jgi:hypothetical protein
MADEKKPKIDLKARLGKTQQSGVSVPSPGAGAIPATGGPSVRAVLPGAPVGGPPPFTTSSTPSVDPSSPLAALTQSYRAPAPPPAPAQPQRIEVDEVAVHEARKGARRMGVVLALVVGVIGGAVGYVAGGAASAQQTRTRSKQDAQDLAAKVDEARNKIKTLQEKIEAGRKQLVQDKKYPADLAKELGGINVDFDGSQLAGRRFSGFSTATTQGLVDFVQSVQALNDRKLFVQNMLTKLQKPISEQLTTTPPITMTVIATKDGSAIVAPLIAAIPITGNNVQLPKEYIFQDPGGGPNGKIDAYKGGDLGKGAGFAITPSSFNKACPSETQGQIAQLGAALGGVIRDIQGEKQPEGNIVTDSKPGLLERAEALSTALKKID